MITIHNLQVKYGTQIALNITNPIVLNENDRVGIIGSNGAGKTTLIKSILGLTSYSGTISTNLKKEDMAVHLQINNYSNNMNVQSNMECILNTKIKNNPKLKELIEYFNFEKCLKKKFESLSGGEKQRLTIILVLMQDSKICFFDEVTSGLDFETRQSLMGMLNKWYKDKNTTLCIVSHYYEELEQLTNKILILDHGNVVDFGERDSLFEKYCGKTIFILQKNTYNQTVTKDLPHLQAPDHLIAISCSNIDDENKISSLFINENIDYKRSSSDIEIMSINAIHHFNRGREK